MSGNSLEIYLGYLSGKLGEQVTYENLASLVPKIERLTPRRVASETGLDESLILVHRKYLVPPLNGYERKIIGSTYLEGKAFQKSNKEAIMDRAGRKWCLDIYPQRLFARLGLIYELGQSNYRIYPEKVGLAYPFLAKDKAVKDRTLKTIPDTFAEQAIALSGVKSATNLTEEMIENLSRGDFGGMGRTALGGVKERLRERRTESQIQMELNNTY